MNNKAIRESNKKAIQGTENKMAIFRQYGEPRVAIIKFGERSYKEVDGRWVPCIGMVQWAIFNAEFVGYE